MVRRLLANIVRAAIVVGVGLLAVWLLRQGNGQATFVGLVLAVLAVCGCLVKSARVAWYALAVTLIMASLVMGVASGPLFDESATGFCNSVFDPEMPVAGDAPPGMDHRCEEARRNHIPFVAGFGILGAAALVNALRWRRSTSTAATQTPSHARPSA